MTGFASADLTDSPLSRPTVPVAVYRYDPSGFPKYRSLPNVRLLGIRFREGPDPGVARFRYVFSPADPSTDPVSLEQALSIDTALANVVQNDERLVVMRFDPDGSRVPIFDGFAQVPELSLSPGAEVVTFLAYGVAVREWDTPIAGSLVRNSDTPATVNDAETDLPVRFNALGQPNATPSGADAVDPSGNTYPTFLDPLVIRSPEVRRPWSLPMAARYLCFRHNPDQTYVSNPDGGTLDRLLDSRSPIEGVSFDPGDPSTYVSKPIVVPDLPATGKPWPVALHELLEPHGFGMAFRLEVDLNGNPHTRLDIFRRQDGSTAPYKDLYLQPRGDALDPAQTNLSGARMARDTSDVANVYVVESGPLRYEASFVLAPGFPIAAGDASDSTSIQNFDRTSPTFSLTDRDRYRLYVFDETGEGHWDFVSNALLYDVPSFASLFLDARGKPVPYVKRRRVPSGELFTLDENRKPLRARLAISTDYSGKKPGLWDGSGTWQPVSGGFDLLRDRLGIWINVQNPNGWSIGLPLLPGLPYPSGVVKGVENQALSGSTHFYLRLTCVIEGDQALKAIAGQRPSSSTSFAITRTVDASDRYFKQTVASPSEFNTGAAPIVVRDDTSAALAEATARRLAGEAGEVAGSVTIPRYTAAYTIGDKVRAIQGRNLSLRTNAGAPLEEGEIFPAVVGIAWEFESRQQTTLQLSDHRGEH